MTYPSIARATMLLVAGLLATGCGGSGCTGSGTPKKGDLNITVDAGKTLGDGSLKVAGDAECLVNDDGVHAKVLSTKDKTRVLSEPGGAPVGNPLTLYTPYFVFDVHPKKGPTEAYQIGLTTQKSSVVGWAPAGNVARWDTRVGARPAFSDEGVNAQTLYVYAEKEALVDLVKTGRTTHKPIAKRNPTKKKTYMPWPIVASERIEAAGQVHELVKINFLAEVKPNLGEEAAPAPAEEPTGPAGPVVGIEKGGQKITIDTTKLKMLDVMFVIDVTGSMQPYIDNAKIAVKQIAEQLAKGSGDTRPDIAVGLVAYRDHEDATKSFTTKFFDLDTDINGFRAKIDDLKADGGGDLPEAVYDGIQESLTKTSWRDRLATKVVIVIGDASAHEPGDKQNPKSISADQLVTAAKDGNRQVRMFGLIPEGEDSDKILFRKQLNVLASATKGEVLALKDAPQLVDRVLAIVGNQKDLSGKRVIVAGKIDTGKTKDEIAKDSGFSVRDVTEVMEFLEGAGLDLSSIKAGEPTFATGWALCEENGATMLEREVYLARKEVDLLLMGMNGLLAAGNDPEQAERIFRAGVGGRTNPFATFFEKKSADPLDIFLQARGIPVGRSSLLRFTADEIRTMPEAKRAELTDRLRREIIPNLTNAGNNNDLWRNRSDAQYGWISESFLP